MVLKKKNQFIGIFTTKLSWWTIGRISFGTGASAISSVSAYASSSVHWKKSDSTSTTNSTFFLEVVSSGIARGWFLTTRRVKWCVEAPGCGEDAASSSNKDEGKATTNDGDWWAMIKWWFLFMVTIHNDCRCWWSWWWLFQCVLKCKLQKPLLFKMPLSRYFLPAINTSSFKPSKINTICDWHLQLQVSSLHNLHSRERPNIVTFYRHFSDFTCQKGSQKWRRSLKLTAKTPENRPPQEESSIPTNHL